MKRDYLDYLEDLIEAMGKAMEFASDMDFGEFRQNEKAHYAVIRALEIVGEATKMIPPETRNRYPDIPWSDMAGMRDKLIHGYFGVELAIV